MKSEKFIIPVGTDEKVSGIVCTSDKNLLKQPVGIIVAHGAGNDMHEPLIVTVCERIAQAGHVALRFNFIYREKGAKTVDSQEKLEITWKCIHRFFCSLPYKLKKIIVSGKSLGGRIASQMLASGQLVADGLILLGYPLHPPGKKDKLRDAHLYQIQKPMLFFAGTRDTLCDTVLLDDVLNRLKVPWELMVIDGGDHSFHLIKEKSADQEDVYRRIAKKCNTWIESLI